MDVRTPENIMRRAGGASESFTPADDGAISSGKKTPKKSPLKIVNPTDLMSVPIPARQWIVQDWVPMGYTTALYGDGGTGKTLLAQQLMTSCATGKPWLGLAVTPCKALGLFCEDDEDELHRRQDAINQAYDVYFDDLENMRWISGVGEDNLLMTFNLEGRGVTTELFQNLVDAAKEFGAKLVVIDTAADTFGDNENDRSKVRQYIGTGLNRFAREIGGAVVLCAHPSRAGMKAEGDMDGGSTAWSNSVRSRLAIVRPKAEEGVAENGDERILSRRKANYAAVGGEIRLKWHAGVLSPEKRPIGLAAVTAGNEAEAVFLRLLNEAHAAGRKVSDSKNAGNYAPKLFAKSPNRAGLGKNEFTAAMERLFSANLIRMEQYGRPGDFRTHIVRAAEPEA